MTGNGMRSSFTIERLSIFLLLVLVLSVGLLGAWNVPVADDYTNATVIRELGPIDFVAKIFMEWSGRIFSTVLIGASFLSYDFFPISSMILGFSFILLPLLTLRGFGFAKEWGKPHLATLIVSLAFLAGLIPFLAEDVFWPTGGWVYQFCSFAYVAWLLGFHFVIKHSNILGSILLFIIGILLGTAHEQLSLPFLLIASCMVFQKFLQLRSAKTKFRAAHWLLLLPVLSIVLGTIVLLMAPGNYVRAALVYPSATENQALGLISILKNIKELVRSVLSSGFEAILFGCLAGIVVGLSNWKVEISRTQKTQQLLLAAVLFLGALLTLVPLIPYTKFAAHRTFFFGAEFLFAAAFVFVQLQTARLVRNLMSENTRYTFIVFASLVAAGFVFVASQVLRTDLTFGVSLVPVVFSVLFVLLVANHRLSQKISTKVQSLGTLFSSQRTGLALSVSGLLIVAVFGASLVVPQYFAAIPYKKAADERHAYIQTIASTFPTGSVIEIKPYSSPPPSWFHFNDIAADSAHWINQGVAEFYQIGDRKVILKTGQ